MRRWDSEPIDVAAAKGTSWGDVVAFWIRMLDERFYFWSATDNEWSDRWEQLPMDVRTSGLI